MRAAVRIKRLKKPTAVLFSINRPEKKARKPIVCFTVERNTAGGTSLHSDWPVLSSPLFGRATMSKFKIYNTKKSAY
jgi:hypothetical protein